MIVDELITLLKFDTAGLDKAGAFDKALSSIENHAKGIVVALTGAIATVGFFADRVSKSTSENYEWAKSVGVALDSYQRFEQVSEIVGGSFDEVKGDLEGWVRSANASGQTLEQVFLKEAKSIEGMTNAQSAQLLKARGYSETSIKMIQRGEDELKKLLSKSNTISKENLKSAAEYAETWRTVSTQISSVMKAAVAEALPALQSVLLTIRDFVDRNKELVKTTIATFFKSVAISLKILFSVLSPVLYLVEALVKLFDFATFGLGKYIISIQLLTAAFTMLAIAMTVKAVKGAFLMANSLMNLLPTLTGAIAYTNLLAKAVLAGNLKQVLMNTTLVKSIFLWLTEFKARVLNLAIQTKSLLLTVKEIVLLSLKNLTLKKVVATLALYSLAMIKGTVSAAKFGVVLAGSLISTLSAAIPVLISFAATFFAAIIPALISATTAVWAFTVAILANPIGLIVTGVVAAIAAIVGLIVIIVKNWDKIAAAAMWVWDILKKLFNWWWQATFKNWKIIWDFLKNIGGKIWNVLKFVNEKIKNIVKNIGKQIWSVLTGVFKGIVNFFISRLQWFINRAIGLVNGVVRLLNKIPGINIPQIKEVDSEKKKANKNIVEQSTMSQEQPKQYMNRGGAGSEASEAGNRKESEIYQMMHDDFSKMSKSSDELANILAKRDAALKREETQGKETGAVKTFNPETEGYLKSVLRTNASANIRPGSVIEQLLQSILPQNMAAASGNPVLNASPSQIINNSQRNGSYVDNRNIVINTNSSSGPGIAAHLKGTNPIMSSGMGMAGVF